MREIDLTVQRPVRPGDEYVPRPYHTGVFPSLRWATVHYGWIVVLMAAAGALVVYLLPATATSAIYEADAVVTARSLEIEPEQLSRTAAAIFNAGEVAETVVRSVGTDVEPAELIPDHVRLEPVESTVVLRVVGTDRDPETAARLANEAARALVVELQRLGPGVGRFAMHTPAETPQIPTAGPPLPPLAMGILAGALFGIGLVGLIMAIRRPVIDPDALTAGLGIPVIGNLALSSIDAAGDLRVIPHLRSTVATLFPTGTERRFFVGVHVRRRALRLLGIVLVRTLSRFQRAALVGRGTTRAKFGTGEERISMMVHEKRAPERGIPTVVLGRYLPNDTEPPDPDDRWVLVVGKGAGIHRVRRAVEELELPLIGIIYLRPLSLRDISRRQNPHLA